MQFNVNQIRDFWCARKLIKYVLSCCRHFDLNHPFNHHPPIHSITTHPSIQSPPTHPFIHPPTLSSIHPPFIHPPFHPPTLSSTHPFIHPPFHSPNQSSHGNPFQKLIPDRTFPLRHPVPDYHKVTMEMFKDRTTMAENIPCDPSGSKEDVRCHGEFISPSVTSPPSSSFQRTGRGMISDGRIIAQLEKENFVYRHLNEPCVKMVCNFRRLFCMFFVFFLYSYFVFFCKFLQSFCSWLLLINLCATFASE